METIHAIILLLSTALPLLGTAITFISKFIKSDKGKKTAESLLTLTDTMEDLMVKAEKLTGYTGEQKKNYVLRCAKNIALSEETEFNEAYASELLEKLISFSKGVNASKTRTKKTNLNKSLATVIIHKNKK